MVMNDDGTIKDDSAAVEALAWAMRTPCTVQEMRAHVAAVKFGTPGAGAFTADGPFRTVVCDPGWPLEKIERDVAPNQFAFPYPTMQLDELVDFWRKQIEPKLADDVIVLLWTTERWLEAARQIVRDISFTPAETMVWHKPGGFQPFGRPQYNCEFIILGHRGAPKFIDLTDFK
jgi:hypothetical protein